MREVGIDGQRFPNAQMLVARAARSLLLVWGSRNRAARLTQTIGHQPRDVWLPAKGTTFGAAWSCTRWSAANLSALSRSTVSSLMA